MEIIGGHFLVEISPGEAVRLPFLLQTMVSMELKVMEIPPQLQEAE